MNMTGLSKIFHGSGASFEQLIEVKNTSFFYKRVGVGDTLSFYKINNSIYYEDYKGGRRSGLKSDINIEELIKQFSVDPIFIFEDAFFLMHTDDNPGHTFSNLIWALYLYKLAGLKSILVIPKTLLDISRQFLEIIMLYVSPESLVIIQPGDIVEATHAHVYDGSWNFNYEYNGNYEFKGEFVSNYKNPTVDNFRIAKEIQFFKGLISKLENSKGDLPNKVLLIKTTTTETTTASRGFNNGNENHYIENGFYVLKPESTSIHDMQLILSNATEIVTSWGAISYMNKIFFNEFAKVKFLCHIGYRPEYEKGLWQIRNCYSPCCKEVSYEFDLDTDYKEQSFMNEQIKLPKLSIFAIDAIRDLAMQFELTNYEIAQELMFLAHLARPHGTGIKEKLIEYNKELNSRAEVQLTKLISSGELAIIPGLPTVL